MLKEGGIMVTEKARMTDRERVEALLRREKPDRVPDWPIAQGVNTVYYGGSIADFYSKPDVSLAAQRKACRDLGWVFFPTMGAWSATLFDGEVSLPTGEFSQAPTITKYAVETEEDAWNLKKPDVLTSPAVLMRKEFYELSSRERLDNEPFNVIAWAGGPFSNTSSICGVEKMNKWMIRKPEVAHHLLKKTVEYFIELTQYWKDMFGIEGVLPFMGEPAASNQIISPKLFEQFALPYIKEVCEAVLAMGYKHIFVHICGEQNLNLPFWAQIPFGDPGIISIGHEVKLETAAEYFPNDIILGNLEPAIIQVKTPDEVYEAARQVIEEGKKIPGGYIFSPGCELPPRAPVENIRAITRALNDFGWYE
jgi:uroporphyrinogen decarboxylase